MDSRECGTTSALQRVEHTSVEGEALCISFQWFVVYILSMRLGL